MKDRELLEMAAKAAGVYLPSDFQPEHHQWNPLTDDGDALRLAVKLNIEFACFDDKQSVNAGVWSADHNWNEVWGCMTPYNGHKLAATRRAIVRAAAKIGKEMS